MRAQRLPAAALPDVPQSSLFVFDARGLRREIGVCPDERVRRLALGRATSSWARGRRSRRAGTARPSQHTAGGSPRHRRSRRSLLERMFGIRTSTFPVKVGLEGLEGGIRSARNTGMERLVARLLRARVQHRTQEAFSRSAFGSCRHQRNCWRSQSLTTRLTTVHPTRRYSASHTSSSGHPNRVWVSLRDAHGGTRAAS